MHSGGLIVLWKSAGKTSFEALSPVKRQLPGAKVGHAGTLDKFATGVLVVLVGRMTRLMARLQHAIKTYEAVFRFGTETETLDPEGAVVRERSVPDRRTIESRLPGFKGQITQYPPAFSAVHVDGERAYRRARRGETVRMHSREVRIEELSLLEWDPPDARVRVMCSGGTYVRSLARDLAEACDSCAYVRELTRTAVGPFGQGEAVDPRELDPEVHLIPPEQFVRRLPGVNCAVIKMEQAGRIANGAPLTDDRIHDPPREDGLVAVYTRNGSFVALADRRNGYYEYQVVVPEAVSG